MSKNIKIKDRVMIVFFFNFVVSKVLGSLKTPYLTFLTTANAYPVL